MNVLVVGGGGREHAIALKLRENPAVQRIFAAPGNGGMAAFCTLVPIKAADVEGMVKFAVDNGVDFVVVAPDDPLVLGMADAMEAAGIPAFGPSKAAAAIEGSKVFSKNLMKKYGIPTARYETFDNEAEAAAYVKEQNTYPTVIKADGLAWGRESSLPETRQRPWRLSTPSWGTKFSARRETASSSRNFWRGRKFRYSPSPTERRWCP